MFLLLLALCHSALEGRCAVPKLIRVFSLAALPTDFRLSTLPPSLSSPIRAYKHTCTFFLCLGYDVTLIAVDWSSHPWRHMSCRCCCDRLDSRIMCFVSLLLFMHSFRSVFENSKRWHDIDQLYHTGYYRAISVHHRFSKSSHTVPHKTV